MATLTLLTSKMIVDLLWKDSTKLSTTHLLTLKHKGNIMEVEVVMEVIKEEDTKVDITVVKAMEVDEKPTEDYSDIGGCDKQIQELIEAVVLVVIPSDQHFLLHWCWLPLGPRGAEGRLCLLWVLH